MALASLMEELMKEWELTAPLPQDMPGVYTVPLEEGLNFTISGLPQGGVALNCNIAPIGRGQEEALYTAALQGNLFGQGTKGALLGLNDSGSLLTLSRQIEYDVNFKEFRDIVEDFINTIDVWREEATKYQ